MAGANLSAENAPRDVDQLMSFGRYSLRNLAYEIGLISKEDPARVTAFDKLALRDRAEEVCNSLQQIDKKQGSDAKETKAANKRTPAKPKETKAAPEPKASPKADPAADAGGINALLLEQLAELKATAVAQSQELAALHEQLTMIVSICKANMYMNGLVGEHIMQGDINEMIAEGFTGGSEIEVPEPDEGNG